MSDIAPEPQRLSPSSEYTRWRDEVTMKSLEQIVGSTSLGFREKDALKERILTFVRSERTIAVGHAVLGTAFETSSNNQEE